MRRFLTLFIALMIPFYVWANQNLNSVFDHHQDTLSQDVIKVVKKVLMCAEKNKLEHNNILTLIDYSLPSNKKRLWVFDLNENKLLFHTYVSHGIKSGLLESDFFSNKNKSKASSIGVFNTDFSYNGRYGLAVKLNGLEKNFNDKAYDRFLVIHPAWYVTDEFIEKYGRLGRSWGCPAISYDLVDPLINTIKDNSLLVVYYPSDKWLSESNFLTCDQLSVKNNLAQSKRLPKAAREEHRSEVIFVDKNKNNKRDDNDPVVVVSADNYKNIFKKKVPLSRMLRRQFNNTEYIVLNESDLKLLDTNFDTMINNEDSYGFDFIEFVIAEVKNIGGYWATEFKSVKNGDELHIYLNGSEAILKTKKESLPIKSTDKFIRWLGL